MMSNLQELAQDSGRQASSCEDTAVRSTCRVDNWVDVVTVLTWKAFDSQSKLEEKLVEGRGDFRAPQGLSFGDIVVFDGPGNKAMNEAYLHW